MRYSGRVGKEPEGIMEFTLARNVTRSEYRIQQYCRLTTYIGAKEGSSTIKVIQLYYRVAVYVFQSANNVVLRM